MIHGVYRENWVGDDMAQLTAEQIFGPDGREKMRTDLMRIADNRADLEKAARAGLDVTTMMAELETAETRLKAIQREYYPDLSVPTRPR